LAGRASALDKKHGRQGRACFQSGPPVCPARRRAPRCLGLANCRWRASGRLQHNARPPLVCLIRFVRLHRCRAASQKNQMGAPRSMGRNGGTGGAGDRRAGQTVRQGPPPRRVSRIGRAGIGEPNSIWRRKNQIRYHGRWPTRAARAGSADLERAAGGVWPASRSVTRIMQRWARAAPDPIGFSRQAEVGARAKHNGRPVEIRGRAGVANGELRLRPARWAFARCTVASATRTIDGRRSIGPTMGAA
jgi:hypothetical protein